MSKWMIDPATKKWQIPSASNKWQVGTAGDKCCCMTCGNCCPNTCLKLVLTNTHVFSGSTLVNVGHFDGTYYLKFDGCPDPAFPNDCGYGLTCVINETVGPFHLTLLEFNVVLYLDPSNKMFLVNVGLILLRDDGVNQSAGSVPGDVEASAAGCDQTITTSQVYLDSTMTAVVSFVSEPCPDPGSPFCIGDDL